MLGKPLKPSNQPLPIVMSKHPTVLDCSSEHFSTHSSKAEKSLERKLLLKLDLHVMPILFLLFLISFVDRSNLANARIEGLEKSLHMNPKGNGYNVALFSFTVPYVLFEVPSNIMMKKVPPNIWLSGLMICWGLCTMGQGFTQSFGGLVTCRALMGLFESGFVPGCAYLIGSYYKRTEFLFRYSIFFNAAVLAGAFSAFLAYLLAKMDGVGGYEGWRWIFIIEGIITVVVASASFWIVAPWPENAEFLDPNEKALLLKRLALDRGNATTNQLTLGTFKSALTDWKIWTGMLAYFGADHTASAITSFQPTILKQLGYTSSQAQVHAIPVYVVALIFSITAAYLSDRLSHRYIFCMLGVVLATVGWGIELAQAGTPAVRYFGIYCCTAGVYVLMPVLVVWLMNNLGSGYKQAIGSAFQLGGGNCAALISSNVFISAQAPRYPVGFGVGFTLNVFAGLCCTILFLGLRRENRRRDGGARDERWGMDRENLTNLGDDHPSFRYTL